MYRSLTSQEISELERRGCSSSDWSNIEVKEGFNSSSVSDTCFEGAVKIGSFRQKINLGDGILKPSGIRNCFIENCTIGDDVLISNVQTLANYHISDNVAIENVGKLLVSGESSFGNGVEIEVLNEGGGREMILFDRLTSQIAYLQVVYRHNPRFSSALKEIILSWCRRKVSNRGLIGRNVRILNSGSIRNVNFGDAALISGVSVLEEGTVAGSDEAPVILGENVVAKKFIVLGGSVIDSGAILTSTFVGEGVRMGKQFSAENSAFFANCEAFHGEACSLFAGPYTVTHHKSTLLIAAMTSFYNAGSGTNQSNHMYKLGPLHQGILERGSKTGSFSYLLWPSLVGPFSVVMEKHAGNFDASEFPFSYINVENGKSVLTPAMNLFTVGTVRDSEKWPTRDRRKGNEKLDLIHFDLLNPFIIGKINRAVEIIRSLQETASKTQEYVSYKGLYINRLMFRTAVRYYEIPVHIFIGEQIIKRIDSQSASFVDLREKLKPPKHPVSGKWIDLFGLLLPETEKERILEGITSGKISSLSELQHELKLINANYTEDAYSWCIAFLKDRMSIDIETLSKDQLTGIIENWRSNCLKLNNMVLKDAEKEFDRHSKISYGHDGDETTVENDFRAIRGSYEENKFVGSVKKASAYIEEKAAKVIGIINQLE